MKKNIVLPALLLAGLVLAACGQAFADKSMNTELRHLSGNQISVKVGEVAFTIDLYDNETAKDLLAQLPLTLTANDYAGYDEKVVRLKGSLSMKGAPSGDNPLIPEFGYYHPGKWLAIYYGHIGYWSGKVPLGRINASIDQLRSIPDNAQITMELVKK